MTPTHLQSKVKIIFLWGFMASGKTTLGKELAIRLGFAFQDLDAAIEEMEMMKVSEIFSRKGEVYFRQLEHETLKQVISLSDKVVVSTGGGTPCHFNNADLMNKAGITVYLKVSSKSLKQRLNEKQVNVRPLIKNHSWEDILELYQQREFYYKSAHLVVSNDHHRADALEDILKQLQLSV